MLLGPGAENAGAIDAGANLAIVFKSESHNHPSAVEPFQDSATGVGATHAEARGGTGDNPSWRRVTGRWKT